LSTVLNMPFLQKWSFSYFNKLRIDVNNKREHKPNYGYLKLDLSLVNKKKRNDIQLMIIKHMPRTLMK
jgi:hypothetical protein